MPTMSQLVELEARDRNLGTVQNNHDRMATRSQRRRERAVLDLRLEQDEQIPVARAGCRREGTGLEKYIFELRERVNGAEITVFRAKMNHTYIGGHVRSRLESSENKGMFVSEWTAQFVRYEDAKKSSPLALCLPKHYGRIPGIKSKCE